MSQEIIEIDNRDTSPALPRAHNPKELAEFHASMVDIVKTNFVINQDYGPIPGTKGNTLLKPGAEKICVAFDCHPEYELIESEREHNFENIHYGKTVLGMYRFVYKCKIVRNKTGAVIGEGHGSCSTLESKYASRPRDVENTVCKMAQKRAFVAATLHSFGLSNRFTQDVEDNRDDKRIAEMESRLSLQASTIEAQTASLNEQERRFASAMTIFNKSDAVHAAWLQDICIKKKIADETYLKIEAELHGLPKCAVIAILERNANVSR